jgi:Mrp family chromosome partitioning ATPase
MTAPERQEIEMDHIEKAVARAREMRSKIPGAFHHSTQEKAQASVNGVTPDYVVTRIIQADPHRSKWQRLVADDLNHPVANVYRVLRAQVLQRMKKMGMQTLGVTSARPGDGRSTTAANLAISIALDVNQTVLLADLNLREPSIHRKFGIEPKHGVEDYLRGECELKDCLVNPGMQRLVILPARVSKGDAAEMLTSPRMTALCKELRSRYADRVIIFDLPSILESGETLGFLPNVDGVLFVARSGRTTKAELDRAADLLKNNQIVGTLLNANR